MAAFHEDFDNGFDIARWLPSYLPHWSSRRESAASWLVEESVLTLSIPPSQGLWCDGVHVPPLRVSGVQSGAFSGPAGSSVGQQPFAPDLVVAEEQPLWTGWTWNGGLLEVRARMDLSAHAMASVWMIGMEDSPERSGEICVFEVFGDAIDPAGAAIGQGIHAFRDPDLAEDFAVARHPLDVTRWHTFAVDWRDDQVVFMVDGEVTRTVGQSPTYPMQMMIAVFDFPDPKSPGRATHVPRLLIDDIRVTDRP